MAGPCGGFVADLEDCHGADDDGNGGQVLDIMGGFREKMPQSAVEQVLGSLGCMSCLLFPILVVAYLVMAGRAGMEFNREFASRDSKEL